MERRIACRAVLRLEFANEFIKAGFMRNMLAGKLQNTFASKGVLKRLLTNRTLTTHKGPLATRATAIRVRCHDVIIDSSDSSRSAANARPDRAGRRMRSLKVIISYKHMRRQYTTEEQGLVEGFISRGPTEASSHRL